MSEAVEVDVIILSWNRLEETIEAITSALEQEGISKTVCVVDQGSAAENLDALKDFVADKPEVRLQPLGENTGCAEGRNIASRMGSAPYIVALDNDAVFADTHTLAKAVRYLEREKDLAAIAFRILNYFTGDDDEISWGYPDALRPRSNEEFFTTRFVGAGHAIRRAAFEASGGYDADLFIFSEELDLGYRMLNLGYKIKYVPDVAVLHKVSPEARLGWDRDRYYYTVRNRLYIHYKTGTGMPRIIVSAILRVIRGAYNGLLVQAVKGVVDAIGMCRRFSASSQDKAIYRLSEDTKRYIRKYDLKDQVPLWRQIRQHTINKLP